MNDLLALTRINLKAIFNINVIKNGNNSDSKKQLKKALMLLFGLGLLVYYVYLYASMSIKGFAELNIPYILLSEFMLITSIFLLFTNFYKIKGLLFGFKDFDILMSLPIKKSVVLLSKIFMLYISNLIYGSVIMIPAFIVYLLNVNVSFITIVLFIITFFIIPLVPIIISTIIGSVLAIITSKFKKKNILDILLSILLFMGIMFISSKMENFNNIDLANIGNSMVKLSDRFYPLTGLYTNIIKDNSAVSLCIFIFIPLLLFYLYVGIIEKYYVKINNNITRTFTNKKFKLGETNKKRKVISLYIKEIKRYFSSANYVMNTAIGPIMLTLTTLGTILFGADKIEAFLQIPGLSKILETCTPILLGLFVGLNSSTASSFSLEGKNLWIIKTIPVNFMDIIKAKISVYLTIAIPTIIINSVLLTIFLKLSIINFILCLMISFGYTLLVSITGIILDLKHINVTWTSEIKVIKQSFQAFMSLLIGMLSAIIPLALLYKYNLNNNLYIFILGLIIYMICLFEYIYLKNNGEKVFKSIE